MKKIILGSLCAAFACNGALAKVSDEEIIALFPLSAQGINVSIQKREKLEDTAFEKITILLKSDKQELEQVMFSDGKYLFPDIIDTAAKRSYLQEFEAMQAEIRMKEGTAKLAGLLKTYPKDKIISLGNDDKKATLVIFTDPLCPYCKEEMKNIKNRLKEANLRLIFTPIPSHGEEAVAKSISIQREVKSAKNDEEIIKILEKYYADGSKPASGISAADISAEQKLINAVFDTGAIRGVPAIIEGQKLGF